MKRVIILLLVAVMVFGMVGCGESQPTRETDINKFIENYKRSELSTLTEKPGEFLADLYATISGASSADYANWNFSEYSPGDKYYYIETILFNLPAVISVGLESEAIGAEVGVYFTTNDTTKDINIANTIREHVIKEYREADLITIDGLVISEHEWRANYYEAYNCRMAWDLDTDTQEASLDIRQSSLWGTSEVQLRVSCYDINE